MHAKSSLAAPFLTAPVFTLTTSSIFTNAIFAISKSTRSWLIPVLLDRSAIACSTASAILVFSSSLFAFVSVYSDFLYPALIAACVAFRSIRYSSTNLCCFLESWKMISYRCYYYSLFTHRIHVRYAGGILWILINIKQQACQKHYFIDNMRVVIFNTFCKCKEILQLVLWYVKNVYICIRTSKLRYYQIFRSWMWWLCRLVGGLRWPRRIVGFDDGYESRVL